MAARPSPTKEWHTKSYEAIAPTNPKLSFAGNPVIITGGGTETKARAVQSFAQAGAAHIPITTRREAPLQAVKAKTGVTFTNINISVHVDDMVDAVHLKKRVDCVGNGNVPLANASSLPTSNTIVASDVEKWRRGCEANVKGTFMTLEAFIPTVNEGVSVVSVSTAVFAFPSNQSVAFVPGEHDGIVEVDGNLCGGESGYCSQDYPSWGIFS